MLQQAEGRERTKDKLPTFAAMDDWWYPVRLSLEQCSSELTARYKAQLVNGKWTNGTCLDLTGGYGVDTWFLSEHFEHTDYVEQNEELCRIMAHNAKWKIENGQLKIHNTTAEEFLSKMVNGKWSNGKCLFSLIYLDPARRDTHGGKVFRLEDCTPNVVELLPALLEHLRPEGQLMLKLSPMLDITQAVSTLAHSPLPLAFDVHVVAVKNEVKEVLVLGRKTGSVPERQKTEITAIDLSKPEQAFRFTKAEEMECPSSFPYLQIVPLGRELSPFTFLYEPNAAIMKAGAFKLVGQRFGLRKLDVNTHLYGSDRLVQDFPGRIWRIERTVRDRKDLPDGLTQANILTRNYPLRPDELKKKLHLRDGGTAYIIGTRISGKPIIFFCAM